MAELDTRQREQQIFFALWGEGGMHGWILTDRTHLYVIGQKLIADS
jgi:hypothetical protein